MTRLSQSISRARKSRSKPSVMSIAAAMPIRHPMDEVVLVLPVPPSVNALHDFGRGRPYRSAAYKDWIEHAGRALIAQRPGRIIGEFRAVIDLPASLKGDPDNYAKAPLDLLQAHGVISNDKLAQSVMPQRTEGQEFRVTVTRLGT